MRLNPMHRWPRAPRRMRREDGFYSFISYSTRDDEIGIIKPIIDEYCEALRSRVPYVPVFFDRFYIPDGHSDLLHYLEDAIHQSDFTTSFLSPGYASSAWCGFEWWESYRISLSHRCPKCGSHPMLHVLWKEFDDRPLRGVFSNADAMNINIANEVKQKDYSKAVAKAVSSTLEFLDRAYG